MRQVVNGRSGCFTKKIHTDNKQKSIKKTGNKNPFPESVLHDEMMRFNIGLDSYDNFLKQDLNLGKYKEKLRAISHEL